MYYKGAHWCRICCRLRNADIAESFTDTSFTMGITTAESVVSFAMPISLRVSSIKFYYGVHEYQICCGLRHTRFPKAFNDASFSMKLIHAKSAVGLAMDILLGVSMIVCALGLRAFDRT